MNKTVKVFKGEQIIIDEAFLADTFFNRFFGLLPLKKLEEHKGIILIPCKQIHTFLMKFPIDAVFLSKENMVLHIEHSIEPNKTTRYMKNAKCVLEINSGSAQKYGINIGDILKIQEVKG